MWLRLIPRSVGVVKLLLLSLLEQMYFENEKNVLKERVQSLYIIAINTLMITQDPLVQKTLWKLKLDALPPWYLEKSFVNVRFFCRVHHIWTQQ